MKHLPTLAHEHEHDTSNGRQAGRQASRQSTNIPNDSTEYQIGTPLPLHLPSRPKNRERKKKKNFNTNTTLPPPIASTTKQNPILARRKHLSHSRIQKNPPLKEKKKQGEEESQHRHRPEEKKNRLPNSIMNIKTCLLTNFPFPFFLSFSLLALSPLLPPPSLPTAHYTFVPSLTSPPPFLP